MKLTKTHIDAIKPYWRNARLNDSTVEAVKKSIEQYGYNQPLVVDADLVIIAGHARWKALKALGFTEIEVIVADLPEEKAKQYRIADNKTHELTQWDEKELMMELKEIGNFDDMQTFFDKDLTTWLDDTGHQNQPTTEQDVKTGMAEVDARFEPRPEKILEILCPHCTEIIGIKESEIENLRAR